MKSLDDLQYECAAAQLGVNRQWLEKVVASTDGEIVKGIKDGNAAIATMTGGVKDRAEKIVRALGIVAADRGLVA